jgi:sulfite reductase alpha subunit-like flavoprotein
MPLWCLRAEGGMSREAAQDYLRRMQSGNRFQLDVF